jgi:hypothetical protein
MSPLKPDLAFSIKPPAYMMFISICVSGLTVVACSQLHPENQSKTAGAGA